jgi:plasmid stability protein
MRIEPASRIMSRTTIDLDPSVLRELRRRSAREGKSMGQIASELLARAVATDRETPAPEFIWASAPLGPARIDLEDKEAVRRALDESG